MKKAAKKIPLIRKASGNFIQISLVLMILSTSALYFYVNNLLQREEEEELYSTTARISAVLEKEDLDLQLSPMVEVRKVSGYKPEILKDTIIYDPSQREMETFRELISYQKIKGQYYQISTRTLVVESDEVLFAIVVSYIIIILIMFVFLYYFNQKTSSKLWQPFFANLQTMKAFSIHAEFPIETVDSDILEFTELGGEIEVLTEKVRADYRNLKQFTEDVSHELQTPLAIIQAKIENMLNEGLLNNQQYQSLTSIQRDIYRLTQLNKRLTLLTKIENNQFLKIQPIYLHVILEQLIANLSEISPVRIDYFSQATPDVTMDVYLAEILCSNLVSNAIKYSYSSQPITVKLDKHQLVVSNYGKNPIHHPDKLFIRFYKESEINRATGLGLAIVKRICVLYGFNITYSYKEDKHIFSVEFDSFI
ncbi:sensor histidine kinase [Pustulibacterium marinum]|nr:HAMP domain-containing sensor histidine kinase [Pustulibacterium marinum]